MKRDDLMLLAVIAAVLAFLRRKVEWGTGWVWPVPDALTFDGRRSGSARAAATPSMSQDPVAALQACAGAGLTAFAIDARLQTMPQISG